MSANRWTVEPAVVRALANESATAVEWLGDLGVRFYDRIYFSSDEPAPRGHSAIGKGRAIVDTLYGEVRKRKNIEVALGRRIDRLLVSGGRVVGAAAGGYEVTAGATVLAMGGFGANPKRVDELLPQIRAHAGDYFWYMGGDTSQGDIFTLVEPLNVQILGRNRAQMAIRPDFVRIPDVGLPGWLVLVNGEGPRFFNEMSPSSITHPIVRNQPPPIYAVLDDEANRAAQPDPKAASRKVALWGPEVLGGARRDAGNIPRADWEDWVGTSIDPMHAKGHVLMAQTSAALVH